MYALRLWSVRHARGLNAFYRAFEHALLGLDGLFRAIGYERLSEQPPSAEVSASSAAGRPSSCIWLLAHATATVAQFNAVSRATMLGSSSSYRRPAA